LAASAFAHLNKICKLLKCERAYKEKTETPNTFYGSFHRNDDHNDDDEG